VIVLCHVSSKCVGAARFAMASISFSCTVNGTVRYETLVEMGSGPGAPTGSLGLIDFGHAVRRTETAAVENKSDNVRAIFIVSY